MLGKRPPWMIRAVAGSFIGLVIVGAYTVGALWLYGRLEPIAPDWLTRSGGRGTSLLSLAVLFTYVFGVVALGLAGRATLVRWLDVPFEAFLPGGSTPDYPRNRSRRSRRPADGS